MIKYFIYKPNKNNGQPTSCSYNNGFITMLFTQSSSNYYYLSNNYNAYQIDFIENHIYCSRADGYIINEIGTNVRINEITINYFEEIKLDKSILDEIEKLTSAKAKHDLTIEIMPRNINENGGINYICKIIRYNGFYKKHTAYFLASVKSGEGNTPTEALMALTKQLRHMLTSRFRLKTGILL